MDYNLKCQLCGKQFKVSSKCTCPLGEHLLKHHPNVDLTFFSSYEGLNIQQRCLSSKKSLKTPVWICRNPPYADISNNSKTFYKTASCKSPNFNVSKKNTVISTTVESWKQSPVKLACPKCKTVDRPEVRKRSTRTLNSPLQMFCMTCCPMCFFPFLPPQRIIVELFCRKCGYFLGNNNNQQLKNGKLG